MTEMVLATEAPLAISSYESDPPYRDTNPSYRDVPFFRKTKHPARWRGVRCIGLRSGFVVIDGSACGDDSILRIRHAGIDVLASARTWKKLLGNCSAICCRAAYPARYCLASFWRGCAVEWLKCKDLTVYFAINARAYGYINSPRRRRCNCCNIFRWCRGASCCAAFTAPSSSSRQRRRRLNDLCDGGAACGCG